MTFTPEEIEEWHRNRRAVSGKIETGRKLESERTRRVAAIAVCINCNNPFGFSEGVIKDEVQMCFIFFD